MKQYRSETQLPATEGHPGPVTKMPDELIELMLTHIGQLDKPTLARALQVCRRWERIGRTLLWEHLHFETEQSLLRVANVLDQKPMTAMLSVTRSVTLTIPDGIRGQTAIAAQDPLL